MSFFIFTETVIFPDAKTKCQLVQMYMVIQSNGRQTETVVQAVRERKILDDFFFFFYFEGIFLPHV